MSGSRIYMVAASRAASHTTVNKVEFRLELNRKVSLKKGPLVGRLGTLGQSWPRRCSIDLRDTQCYAWFDRPKPRIWKKISLVSVHITFRTVMSD